MVDQHMLSQADVENLLKNPSTDQRRGIAQKVGRQFADRTLSKDERALAEAVFRILVADAEVRVREAMSVVLSDCPDVPHDVAVRLARDVNSVALPVITKSIVLTDDDLIEIIRSGEFEKQVSVARRPAVSPVVASGLAATDNESAITTLLANPGADIPEDSMHSVLDRFGTHDAIQDAVVHRAAVPVSILEKLVSKVGDQVSELLMSHDTVSDAVATDIIMRMRSTLIMSLSTGSDDERLRELVSSLHRHGRLPPALVVRSVCMGDLRFFEAAIAERAGISVENAVQLIQAPGDRPLAALCEKAEVPGSAVTAVRAAFDVARDMEYDGGENDRERFTRRVIERVLTQWGDLGVFLEDGDLDYLLGKVLAMRPTADQAEPAQHQAG